MDLAAKILHGPTKPQRRFRQTFCMNRIYLGNLLLGSISDILYALDTTTGFAFVAQPTASGSPASRLRSTSIIDRRVHWAFPVQ